MNREQSELLCRQRFEEFGLSERFEFIACDWERRSDFTIIKCKACDEIFSTSNVRGLFRGNVKAVTCPACGRRSDGGLMWTKSPVRDEAIEYYLQGHTIQEVSDRFGISISRIDNELRTSGIYKTQEQKKDSWRENLAKASAKSRENALEQARLIHINRLDGLGFDYIERNDKKIKIRHRECAFVFERTAHHISNGNVICPKCTKAERDRQRAEKKRLEKIEIQERKARQEAERIEKNPLGLSSYQLSIQDKLDTVRICDVCGKKYTVRSRMKTENLKYCSDNGCCSEDCRKKRARRKQKMLGYNDTHRHRARKYGCIYESGITLKKLIKRDGLRCALCGEMCDPNDHEWSEHFGPTSPTIDHIIPMSKGGGHVWNNVQVAHAICNSRKRDLLEVRDDEAS